ncbi:MAG: GNAT family N-acetyltransferase [Pseudomonadota bacterium]
MNIIHASPLHLSDAQLLLGEYFEAINVTKRDTLDEIAAYLSDSTSGLWVTYVDEVPGACVVLRPLPSVELAVECKRLYVRPGFRGRGLADLLLDAMEAKAAAGGARWVYLDSKDDLKGALHIYTRRGYQTCERYNDNPQATVFMRKQLPSSKT